MIDDLVRATAPDLVDQFRVSTDTSAEIVVIAGDNPDRIRPEAAFAKLAGISPLPPGSGMTRINHAGHGQLKAAIYRTVIVRMRSHQPTTEGLLSASAMTFRPTRGQRRRPRRQRRKRPCTRRFDDMKTTMPLPTLHIARDKSSWQQCVNTVFHISCDSVRKRDTPTSKLVD